MDLCHWTCFAGPGDLDNQQVDRQDLCGQGVCSMKSLFPLLFIVCALLCSCWSAGGAQAECVSVPHVIGWWTGDSHSEDVARGIRPDLVGNVVFEQGAVGNAFHFDDAEAQIRVLDRDLYVLTNALTIEAWVKLGSQRAQLHPTVPR